MEECSQCSTDTANDSKDLNQSLKKDAEVTTVPAFDSDDLLPKDNDVNSDIPEYQLTSPHDSLLSNELSISGSDETPSDGNTPRDDDTSSGSPSPVPDESGEGLEATSRPKVRLGKDISLMMQALNSLQSPEEKIAALCKKYADLLEDNKLKQKQLRGMQRKQGQFNKEREQLQADLNKALLAKSKMESLARELNKHNKLIKQEFYTKELMMDKERELVSAKFEAATDDISKKIEAVASHNTTLQEENKTLADKIANLAKETAAREKTVKALLDNRGVEIQLLNKNLQKAEEERDRVIEREKGHLEKCTPLCEAYMEREKQLKLQIQYYSEKFEDLNSTVEKSNKIFATFRTEMDRMMKKMKELEKDTAMWQQKYEENDAALKCSLKERKKQEITINQLYTKITRLTSLSRALQTERNEIAKKLREHDGEDTALSPAIVSTDEKENPTVENCNSLGNEQSDHNEESQVKSSEVNEGSCNSDNSADPLQETKSSQNGEEVQVEVPKIETDTDGSGGQVQSKKSDVMNEGSSLECIDGEENISGSVDSDESKVENSKEVLEKMPVEIVSNEPSAYSPAD